MELQEAIEQIKRLMAEVGDYLHDEGFHDHMDSDELLTVVLRAHLWLDRELRLMIEGPLPHPERLTISWTSLTDSNSSQRSASSRRRR